ncbi:hypothetical protein [Streptomyces sp. NBC_00572]|uniref:hypothetical protein n=1 Tax=Streptomyces sp. NBC_00572 TaxID=2903664 RepID=UPI0022579EB7|nr:hypothetical protein [Streptomyces sp. NBC_00572]MCX4980609.1 hypothetical protein [Streptomyces sp. NBC_00572]
MPRAARRPRRLGALVLCAALAPLVGACTSTPNAAGPQERRASPVPASVSYAMPADVASLVLPTTGEGTRWTQGLDAFGRLAAAWAVDGCARRLGETVPDSPPPMFTRYSGLPDLDFLRTHGFGEGTAVPGTPPVTHPTTDPPTAPGPRLQRCLAEGRTVGQELTQVYARLHMSWFAEIAPVDRAPEVRRAYAGLGRCLAAHEVNARDEAAFFALVDRRLQAADTAGTRRLGAVYATCMKPVEAARVPLREKAAATFRASHSAEIAKLRTELPKKIGELEQRYRIRISFPQA